MSRYIEEEAIIKAIDESGQRYGITTANQCNFKEIVRKIPTADVVPKSEVDFLRASQNLHEAEFNEIKAELELRNSEIETLKARLEVSKSEVAMEIFEEIEKVAFTYYIDKETDKAYRAVELAFIAELKKKYTEEYYVL
mgnify:CR=1 FL=1